MPTSFHLSLNVRSLEESVEFFTALLGGTVSHRDPSGYINIDLFGTQITLKESGEIPVTVDGFHFGLNLDIGGFDAVAERFSAARYPQVVSSPRVIDAGSPLERKKMYVRCPSGYLVEIKGYPRR